MNQKQPTERDVLVRLSTIMRTSSYPTSLRIRAGAVLAIADDASSPAVRDALAEALRRKPTATVDEAAYHVLDVLEPEGQ